MFRLILRFFMLLLVVAPAFAPAAAIAGDCDGATVYKVDHGDCTDLTGDTFDVMDKAYNESYEQDAGMAQRSRGGLSPVRGAGGRPSFNTGQMARDLVSVMSFSPVSPSPISHEYAKLSKPGTQRQQKAELSQALADYRSYAPAHGLAPNFYPSAYAFFTEVAYLLATGQKFSTLAEQNNFVYGAAEEMAKSPRVGQFSNRDKQYINDTFVLFAVGLLEEYQDAATEHGGKKLVAVRHDATILLHKLAGLDPKKTSLYQLECLGDNRRVCSLAQFTASGGTRGINPIQQMVQGWQQGNRMLGIR